MDTAYLVATIDTVTFKTLRIRVYSFPADHLCVHEENTRFVDIASASGTSYGDASMRMQRWAESASMRITWAAEIDK